MEYKVQIEKWLDEHKDEFLSDLSELIAIRSVKDEPKENMPFGEGSAKAVSKAVEIFAKYGFKAENLDNFAAYADLNEKASAVDILGHVDVVAEGDGWDTDPYTMTLKDDGCIYGRGTDDDKGPVIASLYAMRAVKELGIPLSKGARLIIGGDEESGSELDLEKYYSMFKPAPATFSPDASFPIFNTEKGGFKPKFTKAFTKTDALPRVSEFNGGIKLNVLPAKADATVSGLSDKDIEKTVAELSEKLGVKYELENVGGGVKIKVTGVSSHASEPDEGINGLTALLEILSSLPLADCDSTNAVKELAKLFPFGDAEGKALGIDMADEISGKLTLVFSLLSINEDGLWGMFDSRTPICANDENCVKPCEKIFKELGYEITSYVGKPHHTPADSELCKALASVYEEFTGEKCECLHMGGGTYVHNIEGGVAFGATMPGFKSNLHGANERASVKNLLTASAIFAEVIISMCK